ncbi:MAG: diaminopimelate epimerase [Nitrospinae bacterium]|nr:diaminopimelate epimerase [Nitrospinota bacterium]
MSKTVEFQKWQGLGNDFIIVDDRDAKLNPTPEQSQKMADRRFGIGWDQMMLVRKSRKADFKMSLLNADGSVAEMCGNGVRCFHRYLIDRGITKKKNLSVETLAGIIKTTLQGKLVEVDMGEPILDGPRIPVQMEGQIINRPIITEMGEYRITAVSMGNPHIVIFADNIKDLPLARVGPMLEKHELFPRRTNVHFAKVENAKSIFARTWERGAGITLACGTGACAVAVASVLNKKAGRNVIIHMPGGDLKIRWNEKDNRVYMTGPAEKVFTGKVQI